MLSVMLVGSSGGLGVVGFENCGVDGGAVGKTDGLLSIEQSARSVTDAGMNGDGVGEGIIGSTCAGNGTKLSIVDGTVNDDDSDEGSVGSTCAVVGTNLPR
jgi:hypothetical protein